MSAKGGGTQGYRYYLSLLSGLCRGPIDEVVEINIGDKQAWNGHACSGNPEYIDAPDLFGGDDKEGGVQGPFSVFMGKPDQVLPGQQFLGIGKNLPGVKESIGGKVSQMRGVATLWFDGMVAAMNPYLKTWKFRVRRGTAGWHNDAPWYPDKANIYLGGSSLAVSTNRPNDFPVSVNADDESQTITFNILPDDGDTFTINGLTLSIVEEDPGDFEVKARANKTKLVRDIANYINGKSTAFKVLATYTDDTITLKANKALQDIYAMNPAHIVYQCYTDPLWGRGLSPSQLGENSFIYSANLFCAEGFGLALAWYRKEDIDVFIQKICDLVGAVTYTNRETGLIEFKPIRADYVVEELPLFTFETGLISILDDDSASSDNSYNEIIGTSRDPITNQDFQVRAQNPAALQAQGAVSSLDQDYKGIPTKALLQRVVLRDLRAMASGLKRYTVTLDRRAWRLAPGALFRISAPSRGLVNVVLRVGEIDDGDMLNGQIRVKAAIDVFGLPATAYQGTIESGWVAPNKVAVPAPDERLVEIGYRDLYRERGPSDAQAADPTSAYIGQLAVAPNPTSMEYDLLSKAEGDASYVNRGRGSFTGNARLAADITPLQTVVTFNGRSSFDAENVGEALLIGDELVRLDAIDDAGLATITRGVADTIPAAHQAADVAWTIDDDLVPDQVAWVQGETIFTKVLTRTSSQVLAEDLADEQEITLDARHFKPYPPADVRVGGTSVFLPRAENMEPVITWVERNRITQGDALTGHGEASIASEIGTTYTIRIYAPDGTLLRTVEDIAATTWTYDAAMQAEDFAGGTVFVELESVRDEVASYQHYRFAIVLKGGWGYGWGFSWGG